MNFTGNRDIDTYILLNLSDHDLRNMCLTNSYFNNLCDKSFWRNRVMSKFPFLGNLDEIKKYMFNRDLISWKKYYTVLSQFMYKNFLDEVTDMRFELKDFQKLKGSIDYNNNILIDNLEKFIISNSAECRENISSQINIKKINLFLESELNKHLVNPNFVTVFFEHGLNKIMEYRIFVENPCLMCEYIYIIMKYLLERNDKIMTPAYEKFSFFKSLTQDYEAYQCQSRKDTFKLMLNDKRTDVNSFFNHHTTGNIRILECLDLILNDSRLKFETLDKYIHALFKYSYYYDGVDYDVSNILQKIIDKYISLGGSVEILRFFYRHEEGLLKKILEKY